MDFLQDSLDFLTQSRGSHMGSHQYVDHKGQRNGKSVSGAKLWAEIEQDEMVSTTSNIFNAEEQLLSRVAHQIGRILPRATPVIEMGTGTVNAFKMKMMPLIRALQTHQYIPVDESASFLKDLNHDVVGPQLKIHPILDDFFNSDECYDGICDQAALICMLGGTIGNLEAPLSAKRPESHLVSTLAQMASRIEKGWLLMTFDTDMSGAKMIEYYNHHIAFHLNIFDRMAAELPMAGDFDPCAFTYEPLWIASSGQMAHMAVVTRDMSFTLAGRPISLKKGQKLHIKNSFKFSASFFSWCCMRAGLDIVKEWSSPSMTSVYYLLEKRDVAAYMHAAQPYGQALAS